MDNLACLLGMKLDEVARSAIVLSLSEQPLTEQIEDSIFMKFSSAGIVFDADAEDQRVAAIVSGTIVARIVSQ